MPSAETRPVPPLDLLVNASLFLDFDGTLVELADRPDAVVVDPSLMALIGSLGRLLDGRIAVVSGRSADEIRTLLGAATPSVSGSHGVELHWADGRRREVEAPSWIASAVAQLNAFSADHPGLLVEVKPFGVALHYRQAPDTEAACHRLVESLAGIGHVHIQKGKMMVELRAAGADKGDAVRAFMADPLMAGTRPLFLGDDLTDEPAFAAAAALGGAGILVGPERDSAALYRLDDVTATLGWLRAAAEARA